MSHGTVHRGLNQPPLLSRHDENAGMFGRMFAYPPAKIVRYQDTTLAKLADHMKTTPFGGADNPLISAGYTFLGQFIDHDITFDPTSSLDAQNDPNAIFNFRTPLLELDSVYGSGPDVHPHLYEIDTATGLQTGRLLIGQDSGQGEDLPRNAQGVALIGDRRNDENLIISQMHLVFLKFHNAVVDKLVADGFGGSVFAEAQRIVRWHYQWIVINEFLPRVIGQGLVDDLFTVKTAVNWRDRLILFLSPFNKNGEPFIPVEFAVAAYRFGHSQIRAGYSISQTFAFPIILFDSALAPTLNLRSIMTQNSLNPEWNIGWARFFEMNNDAAAPGVGVQQSPVDEQGFNARTGQVESITNRLPQLSKQIDTTLSEPLFTLPGQDPNILAFRNLLRGQSFSLPYGQWIAKDALRLPAAEILTNDHPKVAGGAELTQLGLVSDKWPLWFYVLKEAEALAGGLHLGPVGGRIVGETFSALLHGDPISYLSQQADWTPMNNLPFQIPMKNPNRFTVADLIRFALGPTDRRTGIEGGHAGPV